MNLPDLLHKVDQLGMTFTVGPGAKLRWQAKVQPPPEVLRSLAEHKRRLLVLLAKQALAAQPLAELLAAEIAAAEIAAAELALEVDEERRVHFPKGFPAVLHRCVGHYLAGPLDPPAEGLVAWWAAARRQVRRMLEAVKRDPARYSAWRPPE
jgi:hypothetical protein